MWRAPRAVGQAQPRDRTAMKAARRKRRSGDKSNPKSTLNFLNKPHMASCCGTEQASKRMMRSRPNHPFHQPLRFEVS